MSDHVNVVHPAPVVHLVRGGRKERVAFARMTTPVEVPRCAADEMRRVAGGGGGVEAVFEQGGAHWLRPRFHRTAHGHPEGLAGVLDRSVRPESLSYTSLDWLLARTPLCGWHDDAPQWGGGFSDAGLRRIVEDGRDWAPAAVARFVRDNVMLAGDEMYVRWDGPVAATSPTALPSWFANEGLPNAAFHHRRWLARAPYDYCVRDDRLAGAALDGVIRPNWVRPRQKERDALKSLDPSLWRDSDVEAMLNDVPRRVLAVATRVVECGGPPVEQHGALVRWQARGMVGAIVIEDAPEMLPLARSCCATLRALPNGDSLGILARLEEYLDVVAMPRLRGEPEGARQMDGADAEALGGMTP